MKEPFRRFTDKPELDPTSVRSLHETHAAMVENRTLFPSTVVEVTKDEPDRLLVSGANNRKLGDVIVKGAFKGYALYGLSLEERATCPIDCAVRGFCYGNAMQLARRHRIGDPDIFFDRLEGEIASLLEERDGLMVRLHVLGDFPSVEYAAFWADMLNQHELLACYGYTHRMTTAWGGGEIGDAIEAVKETHPDRFRIRWSREVSAPDSAVIINRIPNRPRVDEGLVCPAQTEATGCCASCGLCWEPNAKHDTIVFIKHGAKSSDAAAEHERAKELQSNHNAVTTAASPTRPITAIDLPAKLKANRVLAAAPIGRMVKPTDLRIEAAYQRDLSGKSIKLIRKIVENWDWAKFKPPICAETYEGLFVIDGQHTAIAAASHVDIKEIPVLIVGAEELAKRAGAFVSHNRDRLAMSALQVFHAEITAGDKAALAILKIAMAAGCIIPRSPMVKGYAKPGQLVAITAARRVYKAHGEKTLARVLSIAALSKIAPISSTVIYGLEYICKGTLFEAAAALPDAVLATGLTGTIETAAQARAAHSGFNRYRAAATLISEAAQARTAA